MNFFSESPSGKLDDGCRIVDQNIFVLFISYHRISARVASTKSLKQHLGSQAPSIPMFLYLLKLFDYCFYSYLIINVYGHADFLCRESNLVYVYQWSWCSFSLDFINVLSCYSFLCWLYRRLVSWVFCYYII